MLTAKEAHAMSSKNAYEIFMDVVDECIREGASSGAERVLVNHEPYSVDVVEKATEKLHELGYSVLVGFDELTIEW